MTEALNALEEMMEQAIDGAATMEQFLATLTTSKIVVPTATEMNEDRTGLTPLILTKDGVDMVVAYTHEARVATEVQAQARFEWTVDATWLIEAMAPEAGLVLFGGGDYGFHLMPDQLAGIRARLQAAASEGTG